MGYMAPPLAELTAQAQTLSSAGDLTGARAVLDDVLRTADADPRRATADLAVAAALHARVLIALGDPESARLWAAFAHSAEERLHGARDERTIAAAAMHAAVLQRIGQHGRASSVYHDLVGELAVIEGPDSPRVLAAEADLATAEHAAGHCATARARLARAWRRHSRVHGDAAPAGIKMLARLGAMERECGLDAESAEHLAQASELSTRHLPADHPLARQAAALVAGRASGRHTCGRRDTTGGKPFRPFPRRPTVADPSGGQPAAFPAHAPGQPPPDDRPTDPLGTVYPVGGPDRPDNGVPHRSRDGAPDRSHDGDPHRSRNATPDRSHDGAPQRSRDGAPQRSRDGDPQRSRDGAADWFDDPDLFGDDDPDLLGGLPPDNRPTDPNGTVYQQPLYLSDVHRLPGDPTGRHARADTPPPLPGNRAPDYGEDGRPLPVGTAEASTRTDPPNTQRRPGRAGRSRAGHPLLLATLLAAGVAAAAAVVILTLPGADGATTPPAQPTSGGAQPLTATSDPGSPQNVRLRDDGPSVSLQWDYPRDTKGEVLITVTRSDRPPVTVAELPAGATDYVVYSLSERYDYCITVGVRRAGQQIAAAAPVCTAR
ncbi:fibronectin type III domain-containing protein [Actinoplanes sp. NPDC026670]|uniref:fibronectin type III domain-containing protein n=1 Tax=Actinoplanes sp. NPDC026670 TaxID=3154700 RepID=UPI0033D379FC